jgi:LuxR family transcriptional regulator, maltose regulon positive regulatory protein
MQRTTPTVKGERLYQSETDSDPIEVGTSPWYDWLEQHTAFTYVDQTVTFTARKSMLRTRGSYWKAYRTRQGKLYRIHLGYSHTLTLERLQAAAQAFAGKHVSGEPADVSSTQSATSRLPIHTLPRMALTVDHPMSLMQTKLYRPSNRSDLISRARLIDRLNAGLSGNVTLVSAPAGFGKTTLLAQWVQTIDRPTAWLSLDEHDNEPRVFVQSLTAALQSAFPEAFGATTSLLEAPRFPSVDHVVTLFINDLADVPDDVILVLDDYHLMRNREIHTFLNQLVEHLPHQLHLVLTTRSDPPLPLARWRARGHLNDLRPTDLRFTLEETEAFLTRELGSAAAHESAAALEERTEGWIAVLRLATLSLRNTSDRAAFMERLRSYPDHSIRSYLVEEILAHLAPAVQELLMRMSMLEQFCAELCAAIFGSDTSHEQMQATLDWLERSNLFLVPLDERQGWYRFHHLFRQLLQQRLQGHSSTEELVTLHRRASAWYAEQGLIEQAIEHALAAGDVSGATSLVEAQFVWTFEQEQLVQMEHWLGLLPEEQIQGSPCLLVARMWILQNHGQLQDFPRLLVAAEQLLETSDSDASDLDDPTHRLLRALIAIFWSQFQYFTGQVQVSLESARSALVWLPSGEEYVASFALAYLAWSNQAIGKEDVALVFLQQALRDRSTHLNATARLLFAQGAVYLAAGKLPQLEHTARHLLQIARNAGLALSQYFAHWLLGVVHYEWHNLDAAVYHFSAVIANQHLAHLWVVQDAMCGLALAYQAQGLGTRAQETTRTLLEWVQDQHNLPQLMIAYAFCGQLALIQNEVEEASQWLEMVGKQEVQGPMPFYEDPPITTARLLLAKGDEVSVAGGQALLTHLLQHVEAIHSTRKTIQVLALQAWGYDLQGRVTEALAALERALALAYPGGFIRTFADLHPLAKVLHELRKRRKTHQEVDYKVDTYIQRILAAMSQPDSKAVSTEELMRQEGLEPLTDREMHILRLLDKELTNKEIARELVVTPGTVKVHTNNVYRKLSVNNRRAAVTLAKALGFLAANQASLPPPTN